MASTEHLTACNRDCPDACAIVATVADGRVVALRGAKDHPVTRGFLCERTSGFLARQYSPERLVTPLVRRGTDFVAASWDEALDLVAENLGRIRAESGAEAVLHYRSGGSLGILKTLNDYFFECFGGATVKRGDICSGAGEAAQTLDLGTSEAHDLHDLLNSRCIVLWGKNVSTSFIHMLPVLNQAKRGGAAIVVINPTPGKDDRLADLVLRPRPGADRFLALGLARVLFERGLVAKDVASWSDGFEDFRALVFRRAVAEWARAADVTVGELERLADLYAGRGPANIQVGWGLGRRRHGGATTRVLDALAALSDNYGVPGGGVTFYYRRRGAFDVDTYTAPEGRRGLPEPLLGQAILDATAPPIRAVVVDNGNPVAMLPDSHTVARALETREFVVVLEQVMTDTAARAHVVLPVTTLLEDEDLLGAFGHHYVTASKPVVAPPAGVKSDLEIYQALAERLGFGAKLAGTFESWATRLLAPVEGRTTLAELRAGAVRNPRAERVIYADHRFKTADGRFHFVTEVDLDDEPAPAGHPLQLGCYSTPQAQSSQWVATPAGSTLTARCHPESAAGLKHGQPARLVNQLGAIDVVLHLDPALRRDMVLVPKGGWLQHRRAANALVPARTTDIGLGAAYYDAWVRLEPA